MSQSQSPLEPYRNLIENLLRESPTPSHSEIISQIPVPTTERSLRRALRRWDLSSPQGAERPGLKIDGDKASAISKPSVSFTTVSDLMTERNLDPEEWEETNITINEWASPTGEVMRQLKVNFKRIKPLDLIFPARTDGPIYKAPRVRPLLKDPRTVVFVGDQQAPYHNRHLHTMFCQWLDYHQPDEGILIGDTGDYPDISRHPKNPERDVTVQECVDATYSIVRDYRENSEETNWKKLPGNHDERIRRAQVDRLGETYNLRRAKVEGKDPELPVFDVGYLTRMDELDVTFIDPDGDYEHAQINVSPYLAARHGWIARKGSGASALATLEHLGFSVVVGHTHRQSLVHKTRHDINGTLSTLVACETGCMCEIEGGLGYTVAPDWQNGFAVANIWPDGKFKIDLGTYVDGTLYYLDERYS